MIKRQNASFNKNVRIKTEPDISEPTTSSGNSATKAVQSKVSLVTPTVAKFQPRHYPNLINNFYTSCQRAEPKKVMNQTLKLSQLKLSNRSCSDSACGKDNYNGHILLINMAEDRSNGSKLFSEFK